MMAEPVETMIGNFIGMKHLLDYAKDHHTIAEFSYTNELGNTIYEWHDGIALADIPSTYSLVEDKLDAFAKKVNEYIDGLIR